ncbi:MULTISPECIES: helix-turn-helix domain-containing protein [unclassified Parabacteroides]|uniref:helix-turn-helix domain-containing protein n=1 Tax=unclassified Parabacteroides TaxID=2649774 RepID=UPI00247586A6|nr:MULTISPECIES: helix-turn-helix domain-containing protein [unclassified Parabacteroides]
MRSLNASLIEEIFFPVAPKREARTLDDILVFVTNGRFSLITLETDTEYKVGKGDAFILQKGTPYEMYVKEDVSTLVFNMRIGREIPEKIFPQLKAEAYEGRKSRIPRFSKLPMSRLIWNLAETVEISLQDASESHEYLGVKVFELCQILKANYSVKEAVDFFRPLISRDHSFTDFVMDNYLAVATISDLVKLSPYSLSVFKRRFKESFGEAPYQWMKRQKAMRILYMIHHSRLSFTEISFRTGFGSLPQFTAFCRKNLGDAPGALRRKGNTYKLSYAGKSREALSG